MCVVCVINSHVFTVSTHSVYACTLVGFEPLKHWGIKCKNAAAEVLLGCSGDALEHPKKIPSAIASLQRGRLESALYLLPRQSRANNNVNTSDSQQVDQVPTESTTCRSKRMLLLWGNEKIPTPISRKSLLYYEMWFFICDIFTQILIYFPL